MPKIGRYVMPGLHQAMRFQMESGDFPVPVLYLKFGENAGSVVKDSSPEGNDGTIYGASWTTGHLGPGLSFDGVDDYVEVDDTPDLRLNGDFTIIFRMKEVSQFKAYPGPLWKGLSGPGDTGFIIFYIGDKSIYFKRANVPAKTPKGQVTTTWRQFAFTSVKGTEDADSPWVWYVDGGQIKTGNKLWPTCEDTSPLIFGRADLYANIVLDEVRIYNVAFIAGQIRELYLGIR